MAFLSALLRQILLFRIPEAYLEDLAPAECEWMESFETPPYSIIGSNFVAGEEMDQRRKRLAAVNDSGVSSGSRASQPASKKQGTNSIENIYILWTYGYIVKFSSSAEYSVQLKGLK